MTTKTTEPKPLKKGEMDTTTIVLGLSVRAAKLLGETLKFALAQKVPPEDRKILSQIEAEIRDQIKERTAEKTMPKDEKKVKAARPAPKKSNQNKQNEEESLI
jgi:hypothetical protein